MTESEKRVVSPFLRKVLDKDAQCTQKLIEWTNTFLPPNESLRIHYRTLEKINYLSKNDIAVLKKDSLHDKITCHGVPWFGFWLAFSWLFNNESLVQMQVNMLLGLFLDIVLVAVIKAYVRRRRPKANKNDAIAEMGPDVFSFPSGHASRAAFAAYFFINLWPVHMIFYMPLISWAISICLSRVLLNRHHLLDVVAGVVLGLFEGVLMGLFWIGDDTARWILNYLSDEKRDGGDYHV